MNLQRVHIICFHKIQMCPKYLLLLFWWMKTKHFRWENSCAENKKAFQCLQSMKNETFQYKSSPLLIKEKCAHSFHLCSSFLLFLNECHWISTNRCCFCWWELSYHNTEFTFFNDLYMMISNFHNRNVFALLRKQSWVKMTMSRGMCYRNRFEQLAKCSFRPPNNSICSPSFQRNFRFYTANNVRPMVIMCVTDYKTNCARNMNINKETKKYLRNALWDKKRVFSFFSSNFSTSLFF